MQKSANRRRHELVMTPAQNFRPTPVHFGDVAIHRHATDEVDGFIEEALEIHDSLNLGSTVVPMILLQSKKPVKNVYFHLQSKEYSSEKSKMFVKFALSKYKPNLKSTYSFERRANQGTSRPREAIARRKEAITGPRPQHAQYEDLISGESRCRTALKPLAPASPCG